MPDLSNKTSQGFRVDDTYEFAAPKFFDFLANMDESGSIKGDEAGDGEWFEIDHSPAVPFSKLSTPKRPPILFHHSSSKPKRLSRTPTMKDNDNLVEGLPTTVTKNRKKLSQSPMTGTDCSIPSPLQDQNGQELDDCDALLAEFGLSPLPKALKLNPKSSGPSKGTLSKGRHQSLHTPSRNRHNPMVNPSPLWQNNVPAKAPARNSLYRRLFQMQSKGKTNKVEIPTKLKVGPDVIPTKSRKPLTIPKEFKFSTTNRLKKEVKEILGSLEKIRNASPFETMKAKQPAAVVAAKKLTEPRSPKFTQRRHTKHEASLPKVSPKKTIRPTIAQQKPITVPKPPKFATEERIALKHQFQKRVETIASASQFQATPVPRAIFEKPIGVPPKPTINTTVPHTPKIRQAKRLREQDPVVETPKPSPFRAKPAPKFDTPFKPLVSHKHTEPADVHLPGDQITRQKRQKFLEKIETELEEQIKAREFHARNAPKSVTCASKPVTPRPLTVPRPFKLVTDVRGSSFQRHFKEVLLQQQELEQNSRQFKAHKAPHSNPFVPEKSSKPLTCAKDIELKTVDRSERWHQIEDQLKEVEGTLAKEKQKAEEIQKQQLEKQMKELRGNLVPKANPIRKYAPVVVQPSTRRLTQPKSPRLSTSVRRIRRTT